MKRRTREDRRENKKLIMDFRMRSLLCFTLQQTPQQTTVAGHWAAVERNFAVILRSSRSLYDHLITFANTIRLNAVAACAPRSNNHRSSAFVSYENMIKEFFSAASDSSTKLLHKWHRLNGSAKLTASNEFPVIISRFRFFFHSFRFVRQW